MRTADYLSELENLLKTLSAPINRDPEGLIDELDFRCQWLARTSEIVADAKESLDIVRGKVAEENSTLTATMLRYKVEKETAQEQKLVNLLYEIRFTLDRQIELVRSILSYEKAHIGTLSHQNPRPESGENGRRTQGQKSGGVDLSSYVEAPQKQFHGRDDF